ncbi:MAG: AMIN domain-containing protein [candidate division WOR-3 bacterium]|nr:AMIN domain-containing protein [candidate division WOR-3 bacterium]
MNRMNKYIVATGLFLCLLAGQVYPAIVKDINIAVTDTGIVVFIFTDAKKYTEVSVPPPPRIVIDFPDSKCRVSKNRIDVGKGDLIAVRSGQFKPDIARVVLDLKQKRKYNIQKTKTGFAVLLGTEKKTVIEKERKEIKIEEKETFSYSAEGKRDPFKPLIGRAPMEDTLLDVRDARVVGIIWSPEEKYALIQAADGKIHTVEEGDRVKDGKVSTIGKREVIFTLWELGRTKRLTLGIKEKE